jgi:hypothetical protein
MPITDGESHRLEVGAGSTFCRDAVGEPRLNVVPTESDVPADPETSRALSVIAPGVDRLHRNVQVVSQLLD